MQEIVVAGVGLLVTALSGATTLGIKRLLKHTDELKGDSKKHGEAIAAMQVLMPNGEWKELKSSVASVHGTVREVQTDLSSVKGDVSELKIEFREHALTEKDRMCEAIAETYPKLRPVVRKSGRREKR
jgi:hypothetical protein